MCPERAHERTHVVVGRPRPTNAGKEGGGVADLARPRQDVLVGSIDLARCAGRRDTEFVARAPEVGPPRGFHDLLDHRSERRVARREADCTLDLDLQNTGDAPSIAGENGHVIEGASSGCSLELDQVDGRAGEAAGFVSGEHSEQVELANLALEVAAGRSARRWAGCASCHVLSIHRLTSAIITSLTSPARPAERPVGTSAGWRVII